jgi:hypothetical protein
LGWAAATPFDNTLANFEVRTGFVTLSTGVDDFALYGFNGVLHPVDTRLMGCKQLPLDDVHRLFKVEPIEGGYDEGNITIIISCGEGRLYAGMVYEANFFLLFVLAIPRHKGCNGAHLGIDEPIRAAFVVWVGAANITKVNQPHWAALSPVMGQAGSLTFDEIIESFKVPRDIAIGDAGNKMVGRLWVFTHKYLNS